MSLATVSQYNSDQLPERRGKAVVIGSSIAGLFAGRILADIFTEVTIIERDYLPTEPIVRRGVPQGAHPHALLEAGRATLDDLFPGFGESLIAAGGVVVDFASDVNFYSEGDFLAHSQTPMVTYSATRPLIEQVVREYISKLDGVHICSGCQVTDYLHDDTATAVEGVVIREGGGQTEIPADLVVDATGRTSRTPTWLENHGYTPPKVEEVRIDVAYSTTFIERPADDLRTFLVPPSSPHTRGGMAAPVEGNRWVVSVHGVHGDHPPTDPEGLMEFAASLLAPEVKHLLDDHRQVSTDIEYSRSRPIEGTAMGTSIDSPMDWSLSAIRSRASIQSTDRACLWRLLKHSCFTRP